MYIIYQKLLTCLFSPFLCLLSFLMSFSTPAQILKPWATLDILEIAATFNLPEEHPYISVSSPELLSYWASRNFYIPKSSAILLPLEGTAWEQKCAGVWAGNYPPFLCLQCQHPFMTPFNYLLLPSPMQGNLPRCARSAQTLFSVYLFCMYLFWKVQCSSQHGWMWFWHCFSKSQKTSQDG